MKNLIYVIPSCPLVHQGLFIPLRRLEEAGLEKKSVCGAQRRVAKIRIAVVPAHQLGFPVEPFCYPIESGRRRADPSTRNCSFRSFIHPRSEVNQL
jgi:hypothetical protein